ncbi:MAG: Triacylglycerol esterase/lipase EstA, alpha/beta hydrolase fold [Frankiales bacterium]|nr:Triacylglycerol esterase/lipase EstA, alpha/beta hydrolase fold [Frankiales bacterium]
MRADEARDLSRLLGLTLAGGTTRVAEVHEGVAGRTFRPLGPLGTPVRVVHDAVAGRAYRGVGRALQVSARLVGEAAAAVTSGRPLDDVPAARVGLAVLNGAHGDLLTREAPALATTMSVRSGGRDVPLERAALAAAHPAAGPRLVVFLHGLTEHEGAWRFRAVTHHGRADVTYGSLLERDLGLTPVYLRYNTGLHISDNGRALADLLGELVAAWPAPVEDLVLVGHSMGGLVARSALHLARSGQPDAEPWTALVRDTVTLGTPHLGAPLERTVHRLAHGLARLPETRPLAALLGARSVGIKDLRRGTLVEQDWTGRDLDAVEPGPHTHVPLHDGARHFVVLATLARDPGSRVGSLLGDLLVPPSSALGDTGDDTRLAFPADHVHRVGGLHHFDLLNHPEVYERLRRWLVERPGGARPA